MANPSESGRSALPGFTRLTLAILLFGVAWRTIRYLLAMPIWWDEAWLNVNILRYDFVQLAQRLDNSQIAPILFLWSERLAYEWFGPGELSLRLAPLLAGVAALGLFWSLASAILKPRARLIAVGLLSVSTYPVVFSTLAKQYSYDLLMSVALLDLAVRWLRNPGKLRWLVLLAALVPFALLASYPAVFVAGGIGLVLAPRVWHQGKAACALFAAYNLTLILGFAAAYHIGANHLRTSDGAGSTQSTMSTFWQEGFPPPQVHRWPWWFFEQTSGPVAAFPLGGAKGANGLLVLAIGAGAWTLARNRRWAVLVLLLAPLGLNLIAAALHRYPYGQHPRLAQFLAPTVCLLSSLGLDAVLGSVTKSWSQRATNRCTLAIVVGLFFLGSGGLVRDVIECFRPSHPSWARSVVQAAKTQAGSAPVVVCLGQDQMERNDPVIVWNILTQDTRATWNYEVSATDARKICGLHVGPAADENCRLFAESLSRRDPRWRLHSRIGERDLPTFPGSPKLELFCFVRDSAVGTR